MTDLVFETAFTGVRGGMASGTPRPAKAQASRAPAAMKQAQASAACYERKVEIWRRMTKRIIPPAEQSLQCNLP